VGEPLERVDVINPFVVRSVDPPVADLAGHRVIGTRAIGKRVVVAFDNDLYLVIHLMIAGRLRWRPPGRKIGRIALAGFHFPAGTLFLTEAGTTRRASIHVVRGERALLEFDRGGIDARHASEPEFAARLQSENHTLKRALTDPRLFSGIGNAYSDEILHHARLSPLLLTTRMAAEEIGRLHRAIREVLDTWTDRLRHEAGDTLPEHVTAFHEGMTVHGRFGLPCPVCGAPVQRIRYASNETNYCARCQTGGRRLADRAMSRLLGQDWPRQLDDNE
jgi:formamidopyrimidine-DNA glycosylase